MRVGVDLGGSKTRIAAFPDPTTPTFTEIARLDTLPDYDAPLAQILTVIQSIGEIEGVGVQMSKDGARIEGKPIVADLSGAIGCRFSL